MLFAPRTGSGSEYLHERASVIPAHIYKHAELQAKVGDLPSKTLQRLSAAATVTQSGQRLAPNPGQTISFSFGDPKTLRSKGFVSLHTEDSTANRRVGTGLRWEAVNSGLLDHVAPLRRQA